MHHVRDKVRETRDWCSQSRVCWQYGAHLPTNNKLWLWAECHKVAMPRRRNREEITAAYKDSEAVLRFARPRVRTGVVSMRTWSMSLDTETASGVTCDHRSDPSNITWPDVGSASISCHRYRKRNRVCAVSILKGIWIRPEVGLLHDHGCGKTAMK